MLEIVYTTKMKRDVKRMQKRGKDMSKLTAVLDILASESPMPEQCNDHLLKVEMQGYRECHIEPDLLLVYQVLQDTLILLAAGTGTHSDLFE